MQKSVVIIDDYEKFSSLYATSLEVYLNVSVSKFNKYSDAVEFLKDNFADVVISRSKISNENVDKKLHTFLRKKNQNTFLYIVGKSELDIYSAKNLNKNFEIPSLIKSVAKDLCITPQHMAALNVGEYFPFAVKDIVSNLALVCDIFINNGTDFNVILSKDSHFSGDVANILKHQQIDTIYVNSKDRLNFINSQLIYFQELFAEDAVSLSDEFAITNKAYKLIRQNTLEMNISAEVVLTTEKCIDTIQSIVKKIKTLDELFEVVKDSSDLIFTQTIMLCFICNHLIENIEWGTNEQKIKLTFVSFFHNITLPPSTLLINDNQRLQAANLTPQDRKEVLNHALNAAKIVDKYKRNIPLGVDTIIKQHHGSRDGVGFNAFPQSISPLAIIFLVADEWVTAILRAQQKNLTITKGDLMNIVKNKYKTLSFEKVIEAFKKIKI